MANTKNANDLKDTGFEVDYQDKIENKDINGEFKKDFLEYAMSVIVARAIPDVRDGLKPVHRRIIYSMQEEGFTYQKGYNKSAKIVGAVMGNYHPHGDSSIYEAMVRLAQPFATRYPLIDGHGNFGNIDGYGAAAQRYTEARMARLASELVKDIDKNTVDFIDTYDGTKKEPVVLPSFFPNLLVNGTVGIAVGLATNMPPHNLREVINSTLEIMDNPEVEVIDLLNNNIITGPDFPTGGIILGKSGIRKAYETGRGSIVVTSRYTIEEIPNSKNRSQIVFTEIPYQVNKKDEIEKIGQLVKDKTIEGIDEIRDESNLEGIRVVVELKKDVIPSLILNNILRYTTFQKSFSINNLVLVNNEPKCLGLKEIIFEYLKHVDIIVVRKTEFLLVEAKRKLHILEALMKVLETKDNTDLAISIIRTSKTIEEEYQRFTDEFGFDKEQIDSIVNRRLQTLSNMEINKLADEYQGLLNNIVEYNKLLSDKANRDVVIKNQLIEMRDKFGDNRRTEVSNSEADLEDEDLIPVEDILVIMTSNGWMKRVSPDTYKSQHRGGKGVKGISTYEEDSVSKIIPGNTHKDVLFFTDLGKVHKLRGYRIPEGSRTSKGIPIQNFLPALLDNETVKSIIVIDNYDDELGSLIFVTKEGIVKKTSTKEYSNINRSGKIAINLNENDALIDVKFVVPETKILICNSSGKLAKFDESEIRQVGRNSIGVKGMNIDKGEVIAVATSHEGEEVLVLSANGYGKMTNINDYRETARGAKGVTTMKINEKTGNIINMKAVNGDEDLLVTTDKGIFLRTSLSSIRSMSRVTSGVKIIKLDENQSVAGVAVVPPIIDIIDEVIE